MNVQSISRKSIYKVSSYLLLIGIILSNLGINRVSRVSAQDAEAVRPVTHESISESNLTANDLSQRYVIFLNGILTSASETSNVYLEQEFGDIKKGLKDIGLSESRFVYFSYSAASRSQMGGLYCSGWMHGCSTTNFGDLADLSLSPIYTIGDTQLPVDQQANVLDWLIRQIINHQDKLGGLAQIDLVGWSLGGLVSSYWASRFGNESVNGHSIHDYIHSIVMIESPVGGIYAAHAMLENGLEGIIWAKVIRQMLGTNLLTAMQVPEEGVKGSIVNFLQNAPNFFPITSIQSTTDWIVNGRPIEINSFGPVPIGLGSQNWPAHNRHHTDNLGGIDGSVSVLEFQKRITDNHRQPLYNGLTAKWVSEAIQTPSPPITITPTPPTPPITITPTIPTQPPGVWHAQYYSDHNWSNLACAPRDINGSGIIGADFSENWDAGAPCPGMPTDNFSARYTGTFTVNSTAVYYFHVNHDDTARLNIDGQDLQNWTQSGEDCPPRTLDAGPHNFRIDYQENTGSAHISLKVLNSYCFPTPTPTPSGQWHAEYFSDHNWSSRQCDRYLISSGIIGADFSENWDGGAPCPGMPTDNFSARYTGTFNVGSTAVYCFHVNHDDTARLNIDGEDLQNWDHSGDDGPRRTLTAGTHNFRIDYQENTGSAHISLEMFNGFCFPPGSSSKTSPTNGAIDQSTDNLTLEWELNSSATSYEYCYDTTDDKACSSWLPAGTATSASLSSLSPNTTYYWQVRAMNNRGSTETNDKTWWSFTTTDTQLPGVLITTNVRSVNLGDTATVTVGLNNVPAEGYTGAEFACVYDNWGVARSSIVPDSLFGADPVIVERSQPSIPEISSFIVAIAGSNGAKATTRGPVFTFGLTVQQVIVGQISIDCTARVSKGDGILIPLSSTGPTTLTIGGTITPTATQTLTPTETTTPSTPRPTDTPTPTSTATPTAPTQPPGTLTGQVSACKEVTVDLRNTNQQLVTAVKAEADGTFTVTVPAGEYIVEADAKGFLWARTVDPVMIMSEATTTLPPITLLPGDIFKHDILIQAVIDEWDAMTIGMNYNGTTPTDADLNCDGIINLLDLELLAKNYRKTGPIAWQ